MSGHLFYLTLDLLDAVLNAKDRAFCQAMRQQSGPETYYLREEMRRACTSPLAGWLILLDNEWERCEIDGIRAMPGRQPDETGEPPLGLDHICPGRHLVQTVLPLGLATLDVLIYPGDMLAFRLDQDGAEWQPVSREERALLVEAINEGQLDCLNYFERVAELRIAMGSALPSEPVLNQLATRIDSFVWRLDTGEPPSHIAPDLHQMAAALVGLPLPSFDAVGREIAAKACERAAAGQHELAELVTHVGLALLPGESSLLACQARLAAADKRWDEALALAAQARPHADPRVRAWLDDIRQKAPYR